MTRYIQICTVILLIVFLISCNGKNQTGEPKSDIGQLESDLSDSISIITAYNIITVPNAPSRITRKIRQNKEGNLLIAAFEDIIKYDGEIFTNLPLEVGFESIDAFDALEDTKGNIWIASTHYGVFCFDGTSFTNFTTDDGLAHNRTMDIYEDKTGNIWFATMGGVSCFNGTSFRNFTTNDGMTHNDINTIIEDKTGNFWFGTRGTVCVYKPTASTFTEITNNEGKPFENVWSIIEDQKGNIWLSSDGLWLYDGSSFTKMSSESGISIYEDSRRNIWFTHSTLDNKSGLSFFDNKDLALIGKKSSPTQVFKGEGMFLGISEDKEGNIWIGGGDGAWCYDGDSVNYYTGKQVKD